MKVTDPVCGIQIRIENVAAQEEHDGWAYFFCSDHCLQLFKIAPARYAASAPQSAPNYGSATKVKGDSHE